MRSVARPGGRGVGPAGHAADEEDDGRCLQSVRFARYLRVSEQYLASLEFHLLAVADEPCQALDDQVQLLLAICGLVMRDDERAAGRGRERVASERRQPEVTTHRVRAPVAVWPAAP